MSSLSMLQQEIIEPLFIVRIPQVITDYLNYNEEILAAMSANAQIKSNQSKGKLLLTNQRVLYGQKIGLFGYTMLEVSYGQIKGVSYHGGWFSHKIRLSCRVNRKTLVFDAGLKNREQRQYVNRIIQGIKSGASFLTGSVALQPTVCSNTPPMRWGRDLY